MKKSAISSAARKQPAAAIPIGGISGASAERRARAASLRSSGSLLARVSRKGSRRGRASASSSGSGRRPHGPPGGHGVYRLRDGAEVGVRVGTGEAGVGAGLRGRAGGSGAAGRRSGTPNCDPHCGHKEESSQRPGVWFVQ
jgi:hypothetical protein